MKYQAVNPFLPSYEYIPDGEPRIFGERLYLFGSHDRFGGEDFCLNDYRLWSAPLDDLSDWRDEGIIYRATQDPKNPDGSQHLFAPDAVQGPDGRYYLYYCIHRSMTVSVAVCDTPAGEYQFYGHVRYPDGRLYGESRGDVFNFDPGVLMDEGRIWLYTGISYGKGRMRDYLGAMFQIDGSYCVELEADMLTLCSGPKLVFPGEARAEGTPAEKHGFFEASSPRKIGEKYYLVYSSVQSHDLCYAVCGTPDGDFTYGGILVSIGDVGLVEKEHTRNYLNNTHGGLVCVRGQWYIFYHRQTNLSRYSRQACAEPVAILPDGSIPQVEVTSCGLNGGPLAGRGEYEARIACNLSGPDGACTYGTVPMEPGHHPYFTQSGADREEKGDQYIANLQNGAWAGYKYFSFFGLKKIRIRTRGDGRGYFSVSTEQGGACAGKIPVNPSVDWAWSEGPVCVTDGVHPLYFTYHGEGAADFAAFSLEQALQPYL